MSLFFNEAINETGQTQLAYPKLAELKARTGIDPGACNLYSTKPNMTKEELRAFIQNERRIALTFEDHRWHDIRRWKIAETLYDGGPYAYKRVMHRKHLCASYSLATGVGSNSKYEVLNTIRLHLISSRNVLVAHHG